MNYWFIFKVICLGDTKKKKKKNNSPTQFQNNVNKF